MMRRIFIGLGCVFALLPQAPAIAASAEFRQIILLYRDGRVETFAYGLAPFVLVSEASVTVVYLKDKQVVPRQTLRAVCQDACPANMPSATRDTSRARSRNSVDVLRTAHSTERANSWSSA